MNKEKHIEDILDTVLSVKPGYLAYELRAEQLRDEIKRFTNYVADKQPTRVLEVGTYHGGTFYIWCRAIKSVENIISIDIPRMGGIDEKRKEMFKSFAPSKRMSFVRGDSQKENTYKSVSEQIDKPVDFVFIDADHSYDGVRQDFELYSQLVSDGGMIAFHDIKPHADDKQTMTDRKNKYDSLQERHLTLGEPEWGVSEFWREIADDYDSKEFVSHPEQMGKGIGVIQL